MSPTDRRAIMMHAREILCVFAIVAAIVGSFTSVGYGLYATYAAGFKLGYQTAQRHHVERVTHEAAEALEKMHPGGREEASSWAERRKDKP